MMFYIWNGKCYRACPEELWGNRSGKPEYWYVVFHTIFRLDFYLSARGEKFILPVPFTLVELDPAGLLPERAYSYNMCHVQHHTGQLNLILRQKTDSAQGWIK